VEQRHDLGNSPETTTSLTTSDSTYTLGTGDPLAWDSGHVWAASEFANGKLQVRLTYNQGNNCGTLSINHLAITVSSPSSVQKLDVKDPTGTVLPSLGAWGAIITRGGNQENGDAMRPRTMEPRPTSSTTGKRPTAAVTYMRLSFQQAGP